MKTFIYSRKIKFNQIYFIDHVLLFLAMQKECSGKNCSNHKHIINYVFGSYLYIGLWKTKMHCFLSFHLHLPCHLTVLGLLRRADWYHVTNGHVLKCWSITLSFHIQNSLFWVCVLVDIWASYWFDILCMALPKFMFGYFVPIYICFNCLIL